MAQLTDIQMMDEILKEMNRIWGDNEDLTGSDEEYEWLLENYGVTDEEDAKWQILLHDNIGDLLEEDAEDPDVQEFLEDDDAIYAFLEDLLAKYKSSTAVYPR